MYKPGSILRGKFIKEYYHEVESIHINGDKSGYDQGKEVAVYSQSYLERVKSGEFGRPDSKSALALSAIIRCELAYAIDRGNREEARIQLHTALDEAYRSNYHDAIYSSLKSLGRFELDEMNIDAAIDYAQSALIYAWTSWPHNLIYILHLLADAWTVHPETLDRAVLAYELMVSIYPADSGARLRKYRTLLRHGRSIDVQSAAKSDATSYENLANAAVANWALKEYDIAVAIAKAGRLKAEQARNKYWQMAFEMIQEWKPGTL